MIGNMLDSKMVQQDDDRSSLALGVPVPELSHRQRKTVAEREEGFDLEETVGGCFRLFNVFSSGFSITCDAQRSLKLLLVLVL
mmetsp:Transcript_7978/g.11451  ORF Transcript_7978/g.11451 Transcript_7978/m.11451 type:complete len:83 (-) Transcript_7978:115-363(-)